MTINEFLATVPPGASPVQHLRDTRQADLAFDPAWTQRDLEQQAGRIALRELEELAQGRFRAEAATGFYAEGAFEEHLR